MRANWPPMHRATSRPATALIHDSADARVVLFRIEPGQQVPVHTSASTVLLRDRVGQWERSRAPKVNESVRAGDIVAYDAREPTVCGRTHEQLVIAAVIAPRPTRA